MIMVYLIVYLNPTTSSIVRFTNVQFINVHSGTAFNRDAANLKLQQTNRTAVV